MYGIDINSSYPSAMMKIMPFQYHTTENYSEKILKIKDIVDYNLYRIKFRYLGSNARVINNLLIKTGK